MDSTKYVGLDVHKDFVEEIIQDAESVWRFRFPETRGVDGCPIRSTRAGRRAPLRINPEVDAAERTASRRFCSLRRAWARLRGN